MKKNKVAAMKALFSLSLLMPQVSLAHSSNSVLTQLMHNITNAHHAFGGLLLVAFVVVMIKLKHRNTKKIKARK